MTSFLNHLKAQTNLTHTENGALTNKSSLDPIVDFFSLAGAMRGNVEGAADLFEAALEVDPQTAVRTLFYLRDVRGGQGERDIFRAGLRRLGSRLVDDTRAEEVQASFARLLQHIPEYGRWDDLFFAGITQPVAEVVAKQLTADMLAYTSGPDQPVSLLAKWLPSENATSKTTKKLARDLRVQLGLGSPEYRRVLSKLRRRIRLLEHDMSANNWNEIDYGKLPSQAHRKHVKAFYRHTPDRYQAYLGAVEKGEAKINVNTVFPYEIYEMVADPGYYGINFTPNQYADVAWANLPDHTNGKNALVMADVSGSMNGRPMAVSVSLALYFAERNKGVFHNHFMTFSSTPQLVEVKGDSLTERMMNIIKSEWGMSTNLSAAFRAILRASVQSNEPPPEVLYIVSDMEFDYATGGGQETIFQTARREFADAGYQLPHVVFWNVNARNMQSPATILDGAVGLVSGCSPTVFAMAVENKTPRELVEAVVNSERYERIVL
jgi:hypothetical protein